MLDSQQVNPKCLLLLESLILTGGTYKHSWTWMDSRVKMKVYDCHGGSCQGFMILSGEYKLPSSCAPVTSSACLAYESHRSISSTTSHSRGNFRVPVPALVPLAICSAPHLHCEWLDLGTHCWLTKKLYLRTSMAMSMYPSHPPIAPADVP
ncbi:hypothetical protein LI328DRAFT_171151 [Trichoderma asperelloides]|nr:hypothetical protein LI328DRAFT_171151 [Trichoderma asperelloides]